MEQKEISRQYKEGEPEDYQVAYSNGNLANISVSKEAWEGYVSYYLSGPFEWRSRWRRKQGWAREDLLRSKTT